jgi:hypothetical protein
VACIAIQGLAPERPFYHTAPLEDYLTLSLGADRETYYVGEVLELSLTAANVSDVDVTAFLNLRPANRYVEVYYRTNGGELARLAELPWKVGRGTIEQTLEPGGTFTVKDRLAVTVLSVGPTAFLLDEPGSYEFWVRYIDTTPVDPNSTLESDVLTVNVIPPPAHEGSAFADYTPELAYVAQYHAGRTYLSPEVVDAAAELIERHARSRYAPPVKDAVVAWAASRCLLEIATPKEQEIFERYFLAPKRQ